MTQEKDLLLKDLCARLPYHVKVRGVFLNYNKDKDKILYEECDKELNWQHLIRYGSLKPYLRPLSSMTEEERTEYFLLNHRDNDRDDNIILPDEASALIDWLNKKGFDYRGLIPMGLALEATEGMYN